MGEPDSQNSASDVPLLGRVVRRRRRELDLRQVDLADLAGVSKRLVETVENGVGSPRLDSVLALCRVLGVDLVLRPGSGTVRVEQL